MTSLTTFWIDLENFNPHLLFKRGERWFFRFYSTYI